ncbi:hypothetical protein CISIN_1g047582mg [Citrus sinensis]|uniref:RING-type E3 ubiquitin transferase n=1 Tax=Citrus sinensis TaxID=2711 RepID=A0A067GNX5_CITSI|nr:hypothetical protein CISIN_1g047582mg [Citrus sinensis]
MSRLILIQTFDFTLSEPNPITFEEDKSLRILHFSRDAFADDPSVLHTYNRFAEIEKQCEHFLSSASDLNPDDTRGHRLKKELYFHNGDWEQQIVRSLLMPFDDSDMPGDNSSIDGPLKLVNFKVTDINLVRKWNNTISLIGALSSGITRNISFGFDLRKKFFKMPGWSVLSILFEGVYVESNENGGERLLCMLGNSTLPYNKWTDDPLNLAKGYWCNYDDKPILLQDDQILLVLRFPQNFNLTRRVILGEMRSLHAEESLKYFDKVRITSQLSQYLKYEFNSELLNSITCSPYVYQEELMEDGAISGFNGLDVCYNLRSISHNLFSVLPHWKFKGINLYPGKLGPFQLEKEIKAANWRYNNVMLMVEHINCEKGTNEDGVGVVKVSAVIRAIPAPVDYHRPPTRTGLSGMTLSAEGIWNPSNGQLCMRGFLGGVDSGLEGCNPLISLYFPQAYSIKERSMIYGSISSENDEKDSFLPIIFDALVRPDLLKLNYIKYVASYLSYNYSKIDLVCALRKRKQPSKFRTIVKQSLLKYPIVADGEDLFYRLYFLSHDFEIDTFAVPDTISASHNSKIFIFMDVLSLGSFLGQYSPWLENKSQLLNVSMHLLFAKARFFPNIPHKNLFDLYLEGVYDPLVGHMYLIGCRKVLIGSVSLERGLDCLIEVNIEYPSTTTAWLINPTAKISITSQRREDDPLHFSLISLRTLPLRYEKHYDDNRYSIPNVSLVMLGLQALGYVLPLITDAEILFRWKESKYFKAHPLVAIPFLLTAKLFQKVAASRKRSRARAPTERCVPNEKLVLLVTLIFHSFVFLLLLSSDSMLIHPGKDTKSIRYIPVPRIWMMKLEESIGLVQDFFLLPQIIGNFLWHNHTESLSRLYYIGFTLVRLLVRVYDCIRDPVIDAVFEDVDFGAMNAAFFTKICDIAVVVAMILLAVIVHVHQSWNHRKIGTR